ncbi:MAG: YqzL family protein [Lachnospiraceae bacterium]|nr:YqzL family protein [Lachnospiraceae bacterium]
MDFFWRLFLASGNIEAYLGFKEACLQPKDENKTADFFSVNQQEKIYRLF